MKQDQTPCRHTRRRNLHLPCEVRKLYRSRSRRLGSDVSKHDSRATTPKGHTATRRTVIEGVAWSVPTIVVAGAIAPDAAASPPVPVELTGFGCKVTGGEVHGYRFDAQAKNPSDSSEMVVHITDFVVNDKHLGVNRLVVTSGDYCIDTCGGGTGALCVPASGMTNFSVYSNESANLANSGHGCITYTLYDGSCNQTGQPLTSCTADHQLKPC